MFVGVPRQRRKHLDHADSHLSAAMLATASSSELPAVTEEAAEEPTEGKKKKQEKEEIQIREQVRLQDGREAER